MALYIRIELWPQGDQRKARMLGEALLANDGTGTPETGSYKFAIAKSTAMGAKKPGPWRGAVVTGWPRRSKSVGVWELLHKALGAALADRPSPGEAQQATRGLTGLVRAIDAGQSSSDAEALIAAVERLGEAAGLGPELPLLMSQDMTPIFERAAGFIRSLQAQLTAARERIEELEDRCRRLSRSDSAALHAECDMELERVKSERDEIKRQLEHMLTMARLDEEDLATMSATLGEAAP